MKNKYDYLKSLYQFARVLSTSMIIVLLWSLFWGFFHYGSMTAFLSKELMRARFQGAINNWPRAFIWLFNLDPVVLLGGYITIAIVLLVMSILGLRKLGNKQKEKSHNS